MHVQTFLSGIVRRETVVTTVSFALMMGVCAHADEGSADFPTNRSESAGTSVVTSAVSNVFIAQNAFRDGLLELAQQHAQAALAMEGLEPADRRAAFDVLMRVCEQTLSPEEFLGKFKEPVQEHTATPVNDETFALLRDYWQARARVRAGRFESALERLRPLTHPDKPAEIRLPAVRLRVYALHASGQNEAARSAVQAETNAPPELVFDHARLLLHAGRPTEAIALIEPLTGPSNRVETTAVAAWIKARALDEAGLPDEAGAFSAQLAEDPSHPADFRALAMASLALSSDGMGINEKAVEWAERALQTAESLWVRQEGRMVLAWVLAGGERTEAVGEITRELLANAPRSQAVSGLIRNIAERLLAKGRHAAALEAYDLYLSSVSEPAGEWVAQKGRGMAFSGLARHAEAATAYVLASEWAGSAEEKVETLWLAAEAQHAAGLDRMALSTIQSMDALSPSVDLQAKVGLLKAECQLASDPDRALKTFLDTAETFQGNVQAETATFRAAQILAGQAGRDASGTVNTRALDYYARAAESTNLQMRASATLGAGLVRYHAADYAGALDDFETVMAMNGVRDIQDQARLMRAEVLLALGKSSEAVSAVKELLDGGTDSPQQREAVFWMGRRSFNVGGFEQAERYFGRYVEHWPEEARADAARLFQAQAQFQRRHHREAIDTAMKLVARNTDDETAALAQFIHAEALTELLQFDAAVLLYDVVVRTARDDALRLAAMARRGDCLFTLGADDHARFAESIAAYEQVINDPAPKSLNMLLQCEYKIGRSLYKSGRIKEAGGHYYTRVISRYEAISADEGVKPDSPAHVWYARAVLGAAEIFEQAEQWAAAVSMLERVAGSSVPGADEASRRLATITRERLRPIEKVAPERAD